AGLGVRLSLTVRSESIPRERRRLVYAAAFLSLKVPWRVEPNLSSPAWTTIGSWSWITTLGNASPPRSASTIQAHRGTCTWSTQLKQATTRPYQSTAGPSEPNHAPAQTITEEHSYRSRRSTCKDSAP